MNTESHPEKKRRLTFLSRFALVWGIAALSLSLISSLFLYINWDIFTNEAKGPYPWIGVFGEWLSIGGFYAGLLGLVVSITSIVVRPHREPRSVNIIVSSLAFLIALIAVWTVPATLDRMRVAPTRIYIHNLWSFENKFEEYAKKRGGQLPSSAIWCDELIKFDSYNSHAIRNEQVKNDEGLSNYAFNANLSGLKLAEIPKNVVLLFETKLAKNPAGGPELISTNNHPLKGCFVIFTDMHVEFVRAEDFNNLRWEP